MEYINSTVKRGSFVSVKEGLQVTRQNYKGLKFLVHSPAPSCTDKTSVEQQADQQHRPLTITFHRLQTGARLDCQEERTGCGPSNSFEKTRPTTKSPRYRGRLFSSRENQLRRLAPAPAALSNEKLLASKHIPPSLDGWMIDYLPTRLSRTQKSAIWSYLDILVLRTYAYDWRKTQAHESLPKKDIYQGIAQDASVLQCVVSIGTVSEVVRHRQTEDTATVARYCAELCSVLNTLIAKPRNWSRDFVVMHGVAALALLSIMMGDYSQWHIHMKGLRSLMERQGSLPRSLQWLAFRTDLIGSCELATTPYLTIGKDRPSLFGSLETAVRVDVKATVRRFLSICSCDAALEIFESVGLLRAALLSLRGGNTLDPDLLMEQAYASWNGLLSQPVPACDLRTTTAFLMDQRDQAQNAAYLPKEIPPNLRAAAAALSFPQCIETAMRLCLLLYIKRMSLYQEDIAWTRPSLMSVCLYCEEQIINALEKSGYSSNRVHVRHNSFVSEVVNSTRPVLIWISLMGWTCLKMLFSSYHDLWASSRLLVLLIGPDEASVDALPESDFEFCRIYNPNDISTDKWDARRMLKDMIKFLKLNELQS